MKKTLLLLTTFCVFTVHIHAQDLERRASFEAQIKGPEKETPGATIQHLEEKSSLFKAGIKSGDVIIQVNERKVLHREDWSAIVYGIRAGKKTRIIVKRGVE